MSSTCQHIESNGPLCKEEDKILLSTFLSGFRSGYVEVGQQKYCLPVAYTKFQKLYDDFQVRDDDLYVMSFPKTGTTWAQEMVWLVANNLDYKGAETSLAERFPFLDIPAIYEDNEHTAFYPRFIFEVLELLGKAKSPRLIKTHLPWELLPKQIRNNEKKPKIIYTCRNAKDCLVSYYHHCKLLEGYKGSFDEFYRLFVGGRVSFAPFWPHVMAFWERRHQDNVLFLKYEDMKADLPAVIRRVSAFLGKDYNEDQVARLADHLSFESMKNNPAVNYEPIIEMNQKYGLSDVKGNFMRSGNVGDFKIHLKKEQIEELDRWSRECVKGSGFEIM